ncbi:TIR-like protein FxsC [Verrucosispora sp. WMMC514]|uniref:TIR-like protein FxsC n=1 Tax=Verrucosispora sp. WMMC514 TaxID=3015156 RepID=UPI00248CCEB6|nr:TIR-like protein FxsC [Verrucosispora sp. WMMC514]WBB93442.1 TIR-like protein FxsC [Verrucosispora sp. WMMC514]
MSIHRLSQLLHRADIQPTARELAEAIWLAEHLTAPPLTTDARLVRQPPPVSPDSTVADAAPADTAAQQPPVPLATAATTSGTPLRGHPVRIPALPGILRRPEVLRALRPLRRYRPSRHRRILDEDATATFIARTGVRAPVLRPEPERWFDVVLAVDAAPAMRLWRPMINDLRAVLTRTGAFRDIQTWWLTTTTDRVALQPRLGAAARSHRELIDPARRRLFIVLTDGSANAWHAGEATAALTDWARTGPVAVLHALPEAMWNRTGLPCLPARLSTRTSGTPNIEWRVAYRRRRATNHTPIPVLRVESTGLASWARLVAGPASDLSLAVAAPPPANPNPNPKRNSDNNQQLMARFLANASPAAHQLAICLSAVPLTLPIMRLVQHLVLPTADPSALAEVILGGLLTQTGDDTFTFPPDIRHALHGQLRPSEKLLVHTVISNYIAQHTGTSKASFPALVGMGGPIELEAETFATLDPAAINELGLSPAPTAQDESPSSQDGDYEVQPSQSLVTPQHQSSGSAVPVHLDREAETPVSTSEGGTLYFFLSYARGDEDALVQRFFEDLSADVRLTAGLSRDERVGFIDRTMLPGERWPQELVEALGSCRSFVALMTPRYFQSRVCGQEWQLFAERTARFESQGRVDASLIKPLMWIPAQPDRIHPVAHPLQYYSDSLGDLYRRLGIRQLMRLQRHRDDYLTFVFELASQIVASVEANTLPVRAVDYQSVESAFHRKNVPHEAVSGVPAGGDATDPMLVHFVVAASNRDEMRVIRQHVTVYGDDALQWAPYRPTMPEPLIDYAREIAADHSYQSTVVKMDQLSHSAELAARYNQILVLIVDAWMTRLPERWQALGELTTILRRAGVITAVLVPSSRDDPETREHWQTLSRACRGIFNEFTSDDGLYRSNIITHRAFEEELSEVLDVARNRIFSLQRLPKPSQDPAVPFVAWRPEHEE